MKILTDKRCIIGEGPIWNEREKKLYFTNGLGNEICTYGFTTHKVSARSLPFGVSAFAFDINNRLIVSHAGGVHILNEDDSLSPIYDNEKFEIKFGSSADEFLFAEKGTGETVFVIFAVSKNDYQDKYEDCVFAAENETKNYYIKSYLEPESDFYIEPETFGERFIFIG